LPLETIELLASSRNSNRAIFYLKQIVFATYDMVIHTNPSVDIGQVCTKCSYPFNSARFRAMKSC